MTYSRKVWINDETIDRTEMQNIEDGINLAHDNIDSHIVDGTKHLTSTQNDAIDGANAPGSSNVFATLLDIALTIDDDVYDESTWDSDTNAASKNAIRDKIVTIDSSIDINTTHRTSDGSDHTFIDQDITAGSAPTLLGTNVTSIPRANVNIVTGAGSPGVTDLDDLMNHTGSVGILHENDGLITDEGATKFQVAAGSGLFRLTGLISSPLISMAWSAADILYSSLVSGNIYYIYVENVAGTPTVQFTDTASTIDHIKDIDLGFIWFNNENLIVNNPASVYNLADRQHEAVIEMLGYTRVTGAMIGEPANLKLSLTASEWYLGFTEILLPTLDTNVADTFTYFHQTAGVWTEVTGQTTIDNTYYNDTTSGLVELTVNKYGVHWIYLNANGGLYVVYGEGDYTISDALAAATPGTLPPQFAKFCELVGKAIVQKAGASLHLLETPFIVDFEAGTTTVHNETGGLNDGDYKHLTAAEKTLFDTVEVNAAADQTASEVPIVDSGAIITATEVEGALQENRIAIDLNTSKETNATHTGDVTGSTALTIAAKAVDVAMLADGTDGELITWSAAGVADTVAVGTATHVLTSNGVGAAPTFQASVGGSSTANIFLPAEAAYLPQADFALTGTVTMTNASTAVTGSGTAFDTELQVNDYIKLDADTSTSWAKVASIESATGLTLSAVYGGTGGASAASGSGNPAEFDELLGTGRYMGWSVAKFDDTLENPDGGERCGWRFFVPDYDGGNITLTGVMKPAATPAGAVTFILNIRTVGIATSEPFDNADTVDTGVNMTFSLNTTELDSDAVFATATINPANVADDDLMVLEVDIDPASTLVGDGELLYIMMEYEKV